MFQLAKNKKIVEKKARNSNLELFRIIVMFLIVLHHYVVNSGLLELICSKPQFSFADYIIMSVAGFGKIGINCFVLITGYFMCSSNITGKKFFKLLLEVLFYKIVIFAVFYFFGYETLSGGSILRTFLPITSISTGFTDCFLVFYLTIPFLNILVNNMDKKKHLLLVVLLLSVYSLLSVLPWIVIKYNYISWFITLYFLASYIRKYNVPILENKKACGFCALALAVLCMISVVGMMYVLGNNSDYTRVYSFVADCSKPLAVAVSVFSFAFFKNINIRQSKLINGISATTFGVLLIHSSSDAMRKWLWNDLLKVLDYAGDGRSIVYMFVCCIAIFVVCSIIDTIRIKCVETPCLKLYDRIYKRIKLK